MKIENMIQNNPEVLVQSVGGVLVADSLGVAERFGKKHKDVLEAIDKLHYNLAAEFSATKIDPDSYFITSDYENRGKRYKKYLLTRDGFSLLVMGFTGTAALHWKLLYIEAFNKMEAALQHKERPQADLTALVTQITTQVLSQVIPAIKEAVEPAPEPPKPKYIYALLEMKPTRRSICHYNGYDPQAVKCLASELERQGKDFIILQGELER